MKLELGKTYVDENGDSVTIHTITTNAVGTVYLGNLESKEVILTFYEDGSCTLVGYGYNLVSEVAE